jgi:polysaccharide biosynthesis transport protein
MSDSALVLGLEILRRRWRTMLASVLVVTAVAAGLSHLQQPRYEASAEVLLSSQNLAMTAAGIPDTTAASLQPDRTAQTQAELARVPRLAERVLRTAGVARTPAAFLDASAVSPKSNADLLVFRVRDRDPELAKLLATEYARQYTIYRRDLDSSALNRTSQDVARRLAELKRQGQTGSSLYALLMEKDQQLEAFQTLGASNWTLVRDATTAAKTQPRPTRNVLLALVLGLMLGGALALLRDALDPQFRSTDEALEALALPLVGRVPELRHDSRRSSWPILVKPTSSRAEAFRILRTTVELARLERGERARTVMVTSAVGQEGKSTIAANLALFSARAGARVILVDFHLRHPTLDYVFGLARCPGLTDVALGEVPLEQALARVPLTLGSRHNGREPTERAIGTLDVLPSGVPAPDAGDLVVTEVVANVLAHLGERADLIVVDAPPLLPVGDARAIMARMGGVLVVARFAFARRPLLKELRHVLDSSRAAILGVVLVAAADHNHTRFEHQGPEREAFSRHRARVVRTRGHSANGTGTSVAASTRRDRT